MNKYKNIKKKLIQNLSPKIKNEIEKRIKSFYDLNKQNNFAWFNELCFCILTANAKAETALKIQFEMSENGFRKKTQTELADVIKKHGHRFHNTKAKYICAARKYISIKDMVQKMPFFDTRKFIVDNIKGLGYKESSHFLRNVGYKDFAIIDRHILRFLKQENLIQQIPKTISEKKYLEYEEILQNFEIPLNKLDLMIWAKMTGKVLK